MAQEAATYPNRRERLLERLERYTELPLLFLALLFLLTVVGPDDPSMLPATVRWVFEDTLQWLIWSIFAADLVIKTVIAPRHLHYLRRHWADVLVVAVPFLRPLRLLRAIPILVVIWHHYGRLLQRRGLDKILAIVAGVVVGCAAIVWLFERGQGGTIGNFGDAFWWAMVTVTTVGYGDAVPVTTEGRAVAIALMIVGIALFGILTANLAAFFVETDQQTREHDARMARIEADLAEIKAALQARANDRPPPAE